MFIHGVRQFFFHKRIGPAYPEHQRALVARYVTAAELRMCQARETFFSTRPVGATLLLRDSVSLLVRAAAAARDTRTTSAPHTVDTAQSLVELRAATGRSAKSDAEYIDAALASSDPLYLDSLQDAQLVSTYEALTREAAWLRAQVDLRSPEYVAGTRFGRLAALAVVVLYVLYVALSAAFAPRNLALGRPVRMSTQHPGTPDPSGLVDGKKTNTYGAHTQVGAQGPPWIIIDLERQAVLRKIVVYNRGDSNFNDGLPYAIDVSSDGNSFREIATRTEPFGLGALLSSPWTIKLHERARYVRIRAKGYIALNEVEVF